MCEGSEHSRCSRSWCLLEEHWKSTSLHSEPGTRVDPAVASGNLKNGERKESWTWNSTYTCTSHNPWTCSVTFNVRLYKCRYGNDALLSIQKMTGGGSPAGGRHFSTREPPICTAIASFLSFDHKGDPASHINIEQRRWKVPIRELDTDQCWV